jgi:uncharacterized protein (DUF2141 family)
MKKLILLCFSLFIISNAAFSQFSLTVDIDSLRNNSGTLMLQLFDSSETVIAQQKGMITDNKSTMIFDSLKAGKYAVRYYHDENINGLMETNMVGKPIEGYGFSNNVTGKFGPPPFKKWLFEIYSDTKIVLKPTY